MTFLRAVSAMSLMGLLTLAGAALAETKVEVKGVHLCCKSCVKGVEKALKGVEGATATCNRENGSVTITASDDKVAQAALDALAEGGYHGDTDSKTLVIKETSNVPTGKAKTLTLSNVHNCCGACNKAIKTAIKSATGVTGDTAKAKAPTIEVSGDFEPAAVIKALNDAGFHATVK